MVVLESLIYSKWLLIILTFILIIVVLGLSYWFLIRQRWNIQNMNKNQIIQTKTKYLSSPPQNFSTKTSSNLTNTDIAYLNKLVRTASDRSLWKEDYLIKTKPRKIPSEHFQEKNLFSN